MFGVSFDSVAENKAFAEKYDFPYTLLCDTERQMGLAFKACNAPDDVYPRRITYVVSPEGKIEQAIETSDPGAQAAAILASL